MSLYVQPLLPDTEDEIACDLFAGAGGWSSAFEQATGQMVSVAINHDPAAVALHEANHPQTEHHRADVFEVDPRFAVRGRKVGWLHASPDCTGFSKAKGKAPKREKDRKRRMLAWVVIWWANTVRPRIISLENVEEFTKWTRLIGTPGNYRECKKTRGRRFKRFVRLLREAGYVVEWREVRACDYGAATIRKRLALIARRDGEPIVWPEPTHGHPESKGVKSGKLKPWDITANHIDWGIPMLSIFANRDEAKAFGKRYKKGTPQRPLVDNSLGRIARGVDRFVVKSKNPYLRLVEGGLIGPHLSTNRNADKPYQGADEPAHTITAEGAGLSLVSGCIVPRYGERKGQSPRCVSLQEPYPTVVPGGNGGSLAAFSISTYYSAKGEPDGRGGTLFDPVATIPTENRHALVAALMGQNNGGFYKTSARSLEEPLSTIMTTSRGHHSLICASIKRDFGTSTGSSLYEPIGTLTTEGGGKASLCASLVQKYYGNSGDGHEVTEPIHTIPTHDRFGFVNVRLEKRRKVQAGWGEMVMIEAGDYYIADIGMRMLEPHELYSLQGFRSGYIINCQITVTNKRGKTVTRWLTKGEQVRMVGNSISPQPFEAIIRANAPGWKARRAA